MNVFELYAKIALDTGDYEKGMEDASEKTSSFADKLKTGLANAGKVAAVGIGAVTTATTALYAGVTAAAGQVASYGDNIDKMSQKMGMSAEAYQEWDAVMQHSGTSIESLQSGMKTLANAVESGNGAFERLGISQKEIAKMSNEELFSATITALQNVENETERTYLAGQLLGRGATELGALLNTSAEDTQAMKDRVHELGGVMSDEAIKAAARYQDSLQDMQTSFSGLKNNLISSFLPGMSTVMDGISAMMTGESGAETVLSNGISQIISTMNETVPQFFSAGGQIISAVITALTDNLPQMIEGGTQLVVGIVNGIINALPELIAAIPGIIESFVNAISENLPSILEAGNTLLSMFTSGVSSAVPEFIENLPQIVDGFLGFITEKLPDILDKGVELLDRFAFGIIEYIPDLVAQLPAIINSITEFFVENFPKIVKKGGELLGKLLAGIIGTIPEIAVQLPAVITAIVDALEAGWEQLKNAGKYLLEGLWEGISDKVAWLKDKVSGVVDKIKSWFTGKDGFDEHSPSKWSKQVFRYVMEGGGEGLDAGLPGLMQSVGSVTDRVKSGLDFGTATVDFASSGLGMSSAGIINSIGTKSDGELANGLTVNLVLPDGSKFASWQLPYLIKAGSAAGTPIAEAQRA